MLLEKGQSFPFDNQPIPGFCYMDTSSMLRQRRGYQPELEEKKVPSICFPSGDAFTLSLLDGQIFVHCFRDLRIPFYGTTDEVQAYVEEQFREYNTAIREANNFDLAEYRVRKMSDRTLLLTGFSFESIYVKYDNTARHIVNAMDTLAPGVI